MYNLNNNLYKLRSSITKNNIHSQTLTMAVFEVRVLSSVPNKTIAMPVSEIRVFSFATQYQIKIYSDITVILITLPNSVFGNT